MIKTGRLRGDKIQYEDGIGCCIWYPMGTDKELEGMGICFDLSYDDIDDLITLLQTLKTIEAEKPEEEKP